MLSFVPVTYYALLETHISTAERKSLNAFDTFVLGSHISDVQRL